jgi:CRP/FNR family transcriptional regulator, cyclic AMP receptor protein
MQVATRENDVNEFWGTSSLRTSTVAKSRGERLYVQGDKAVSVFYVQRGYVKLTVLSRAGKEAVIGILGPGSFFGYGCLSGHPLRESTATSICDCIATRIDQADMSRMLDEEPRLRRLFLTYVLGRNLQLETDLGEHLFNPCETRLARALVRLAANGSTSLLSNIDQHTLAGMVGTTQPRISVLLSRLSKKASFAMEPGCKWTELRKFLSNTVERARP